MHTVGLICEGVSEINVMETLLGRYLGDDFLVNPVEPETKVENGIRKQVGNGGWPRVLSHCNEQKFREVLERNDFLVIQIDSDACQLYGVNPYDESNQLKTHEILYKDIVTRLCRDISTDCLKDYSGRIIFAVCFDEIECWLLPIYYTDKNRCREHNCIHTLNKVLSRKNLPAIPNGDDKNSPNGLKAYRSILKNIKNKQKVEEISAFNYGFMRFVSDLSNVT